MAVAEISMALTSIKAALSIIKVISDSDKNNALQENTLNLRDEIISIQLSFTQLYEKYSSLLSENNDLKKEIMQISKWKETESQYTLTEVSPGNFAYIPNERHQHPKPIHYLCANCFNKSKKSILQIDRKYSKETADFKCPDCGLNILITHYHTPSLG